MSERDEVATANERVWEREVREGCGYTIPWLDLDREMIRQYAKGTLEPVPESLTVMSPPVSRYLVASPVPQHAGRG